MVHHLYCTLLLAGETAGQLVLVDSWLKREPLRLSSQIFDNTSEW
jgi:hypothetical protein